MNETLNYIESYFENGLTAEERTQFEQRITTDAAFAQEVAFYLQARQALRHGLMQEKVGRWREASIMQETTASVIPLTQKEAPARTEVPSTPVIAIRKPSLLRRWIAVAAILIVGLGVSLIFLPGNGVNGAQQLAKGYMELPEVYSNTMGASQDSLQQGISALKKNDLDRAEEILTPYYAAHPDNARAQKFNGLVALRQEKYDLAISRFQELAARQDLNSNPGKFFQANALLLRNQKGDKEAAERLLQEVIVGKLDDNGAKAEKLLEALRKT